MPKFITGPTRSIVDHRKPLARYDRNPRWRVESSTAWQYLFPVAALALVATLWWLREQIGRGPLAVVLIFGGVLTPALGFFDVYPFLFSFVADHYQYHASMAGVTALVGCGLWLLGATSGKASRMALVVALIWLVALSVLAHQKTYSYRDNETLIRDNIQYYPQAWAAQFRYAAVLTDRGDHAGAERHYRQALELFPEYAVIHTALAASLAAQERLAEAEAEYHRALEGSLHPDDRAAALTQLANMLAQQNRTAEAERHLRDALRYDPTFNQAKFNLGVLLSQRGENREAIELFESVVTADSTALPARRALAEALASTGNTARAMAELRTAIETFPEDAGLRQQLAVILFQGGDLDAAESELRQAIRLAPTADAYNLLGAILGSRGDLTAAIEQFETALRIAPDHPGAGENLRKARAAQITP